MTSIIEQAEKAHATALAYMINVDRFLLAGQRYMTLRKAQETRNAKIKAILAEAKNV